MTLRADRRAASPLTVLSVFVLVAAGVTAVGFFLFYDPEDEAITLRQADDPGFGFIVAGVEGEFEWSGLDLEFVDAAGEDRAALYLMPPAGRVGEGDAIELRHQVPAGSYTLRLMDGDEEVGRLVARF